MEVSYNLRYQKINFAGRVLLDKEGEIIIYAKGFRLKGKGAGDKGELISFAEIKEFYQRDEKVFFINFNKEKYVLSDCGTLFDQMLIDLYKARNEFLMEALFMKAGKLKAEFDCHFERFSKFGKPINKSTAKLRLYEGALLVLPKIQDAFCINFNFVNFYEFDEMEYNLKVVMDDGTTVLFSQLGNDYEFFEERMNELLGGMYERLVNEGLKIAFPEFHAGTLLKLAYKMKGGKAASIKDVKKMDGELEVAVKNFIFEDAVFAEKMKVLTDLADEKNIFYGIVKDDTSDGFIRWFLVAIPEKNAVAFSLLPRWISGEDNKQSSQHETYFYKIIMEKGSPMDKVEDKVREIEQALVTLKFAKDPCFMDKRDLKHSPYQYAIRKMPYLRILRKSYTGRVSENDTASWQKQALELLEKTSTFG